MSRQGRGRSRVWGSQGMRNDARSERLCHQVSRHCAKIKKDDRECAQESGGSVASPPPWGIAPLTSRPRKSAGIRVFVV
jgi:hypothetical protein